MGEGKTLPLGPECNFNGKNVPCFCCCLESGSITGSLLQKMLEAIDKLQVCDGSTGLNPFLLLDGHGSRFELEFLEYIHREESGWDCCIGLPYGTSYWQVGDSSEQNGCFKMALTKAKQELVTKKNDAGLEFSIDKRDIVGLVRKARKASFSREEMNKRAILNRGWGPKALNYNALTHPEILASKPGYYKESALNTLKTEVDPEDLNLSDGLAATLVDKIVLHKNKEGARSGSNAADHWQLLVNSSCLKKFVTMCSKNQQMRSIRSTPRNLN
jgi:hypothetical protein